MSLLHQRVRPGSTESLTGSAVRVQTQGVKPEVSAFQMHQILNKITFVRHWASGSCTCNSEWLVQIIVSLVN